MNSKSVTRKTSAISGVGTYCGRRSTQAKVMHNNRSGPG